MHPALDTLMLALDGQMPERALFLGASPHADLPRQTTGWQPFKPTADAWDHAGFARLDDLDDRRWPLVLILPNKSRDETLHWFALARRHLEPGGKLIAALPNTAGAARFEKELAHATGPVESIQKHKCRAFIATDNGYWNEPLFAEWHQLGQRHTIPGTSYQTQAGIFSSGHIDPGSQLLVDHLPKSIRGRVADLGAGWGFLSDQLLQHCPGIEQLDLYEADARALDCARLNLAHHQRSLTTRWHDARKDLDGEYHAIVMNPPFHSGQQTDIDLGRAFIATAHRALRRNGELYLVANRQLPYESTLDQLGFRWRCPAQSDTFKLLFASKP